MERVMGWGKGKKAKEAPAKRKSRSGSAAASVASGTSKARGKGSRSGVNARDAGRSDEEIDELDDEVKEEAGINSQATRISWSFDQKKKVLSYCLDDRRWPSFKVKQGQYFTEVRFDMYAC